MPGLSKTMFCCAACAGIIIMLMASVLLPRRMRRTMQENEIKSISGLENLCPDALTLQRQGAEYGEVRHIRYQSKTCAMERGFNVLFPPEYDQTKKYPVFYMIHGIFGDENTFTGDQTLRIKELVGNMILDGLCEPMIMIFPNMFAATDPNLKPSFSDEAVWCYDNFINELTDDLMPYVEKNLGVKTGRENTAICGFSMGGRETLFITIRKPELAAYVGAIAPAPGLVPAHDWAMNHKGMMDESEVRYSNPLPKILMVCCGTNDGTVGKYPQSYHNLLEKNGTEHFWYEVEGADHDNIAIRSGLYHILRFAFR